VFLAVLASLVLGYVCLRFDETHHARDPRVIHPLRLASNYRALLGDRHYLGFGLALAYGSLFAFISGAPLYLVRDRGLSPRDYGLFFLVVVADLCAGVDKRRLTITLRPDWRAARRQAGKAADANSYQGEMLNFETPGAFFGRLTERRWAIGRRRFRRARPRPGIDRRRSKPGDKCGRKSPIGPPRSFADPLRHRGARYFRRVTRRTSRRCPGGRTGVADV
jgi:hypothetical protein